MIINIRGTSGSGKSTIIRSLMEYYTCEKIFEHGRKQPMYYLCSNNSTPYIPKVVILGHYETPCGGCDTIQKMDDIYALVRLHAGLGRDVVYEGLLISAEVNRCEALHTEHHYPLRVVHLDIPLQECVDSVNKRRWAKNPDKPGVNPKNTKSKWMGSKSSLKRLSAAGVECHSFNREDALKYIVRTLHAEG